MNFYHKIEELQETYQSLHMQRTLLEQRMSQKEEYKKAYLEVKSKELQDEISKIEIQQIKTRARNANLLQNIRKTLEQDQASSEKISFMRQNLEEQKR